MYKKGWKEKNERIQKKLIGSNRYFNRDHSNRNCFSGG